MIRELFLRDMSFWAVAWQSTLFAVIGLVGSFLLRRRPARASQVLFLAIIAAVLVPTMGILVTHFELGVFTAEPIALPSVVMDVPAEASVVSASPEIQPEAHEVAADLELSAGSSQGADIPWRMIMLYGWMAATLILLGRLSVDVVNGILLLRRAQSRVSGHIELAADSARARLGIAKAIQIRSSVDVRSPVIWCWSPIPVLLLPADLDDGLDWVGVICHELAHWRRRDHISGLIAELIVCILPWNPLLWWSKKRMVRFSEQACDDWVVAGGQSAEDYAQSLLNFRPQKQVAFVPAVVSSKKTLAGRVRRIVEERCSSPYSGVRWSLTAAAIAGCITVGIAFAQTKPPQSTGTVKTKVGQSAVIEKPAFPTMMIKGRILDPNNEPAYGARIVALPVTSYGTAIKLNNKEGSFELPWSPTWIEEGQSIYLMSTCNNLQLNQGAIVEVHDLTSPVTVRLEPAAELVMKLVDLNDRRVAKYSAILSVLAKFKCQASIFETTVGAPRVHIFSSVPYGPKYTLTIQADGFQTKRVIVDATDRSKEVIDIGTIALQPQDPTKPAVIERGPDPELAKEFHDIYRLDEQELIKFIKPPFVLGRQEYLLTTPRYSSFALQHPGHHYGFRWDNELKMYSSFSARQLSWVLYFVLGIPEYDFNLPKELKVDLPGDWIVRAGLPIAQQLKALEEIIYAETNRAIRFEKRTIEREVIVAKGRYEFKPHPSGNYSNYIPLWDGRFQTAEYTVDSLEGLFANIEREIKMEIVDETEPAEIATIRYKWVDRDPEPTGDKLSVLLDDLAKTTSLRFKVERRPTQIWFVTETKKN
ncbi:MAG TPA: M56 family metallopeptidase [Sedimentisphaerales bacterium]|nr:M56 family metallopeptidase [Sedimentisphaerales bacterium]